MKKIERMERIFESELVNLVNAAASDSDSDSDSGEM